MPIFVAIYGFGITRPIQAANFDLQPVFTDLRQAREKCRAKDRFHLTAVGTYAGGLAPAEAMFELEAALTFCDQRWVVVSGPHERPEGTTLDEFRSRVPSELDLLTERVSGGELIELDAAVNKSRSDYLEVTMKALRNPPASDTTGIRRALFMSAEIWKLRRRYVELEYFLHFSAFEVLVRTPINDGKTSIAQLGAPFLQQLGFNVFQDDPKYHPRHSIQTYASLRNVMFHQGKLETVDQTGQTLALLDYFENWTALVPDVLLRVIGFDDGKIAWDRWLTRMPFK